jgi:hypothetical protein
MLMMIYEVPQRAKVEYQERQAPRAGKSPVNTTSFDSVLAPARLPKLSPLDLIFSAEMGTAS